VVIDNIPFLLSDTVGFIRKLPHTLIESFKSTLDEVREADILLHLVDISHSSFEEQMQIVQQTLTDIGAGDKTTIIVFNKTDAYKYLQKPSDDLSPPEKHHISLEQLQNTWMASSNAPCVFISAKHKNNINELKELLYKLIRDVHSVRYPKNEFLYPDIQE
jgi:GTP-binding protein HflX